jgi:hypothetical protein
LTKQKKLRLIQLAMHDLFRPYKTLSATLTDPTWNTYMLVNYQLLNRKKAIKYDWKHQVRLLSISSKIGRNMQDCKPRVETAACPWQSHQPAYSRLGKRRRWRLTGRCVAQPFAGTLRILQAVLPNPLIPGLATEQDGFIALFSAIHCQRLMIPFALDELEKLGHAHQHPASRNR